MLSIVLECCEDDLVELLGSKEFVERDNGLLATELTQDEHRRVLLNVRATRIRVLHQPSDRHVQTLVDVLGLDRSTRLC